LWRLPESRGYRLNLRNSRGPKWHKIPRGYPQIIRIQKRAINLALKLGFTVLSSIMLPLAVEIAFSETTTKSPFSILPSKALIIWFV
jgi:hypothetical protein